MAKASRAMLSKIPKLPEKFQKAFEADVAKAEQEYIIAKQSYRAYCKRMLNDPENVVQLTEACAQFSKALRSKNAGQRLIAYEGLMNAFSGMGLGLP